MEQLETYFSNPEYGFTSAKRFYDNLIENKIIEPSTINKKTVYEFVEGLKTTQIHSEKKQIYKKIIVGGVNQQWMIDLMDFDKLSHDNRGYKWVLTCIDVYSRKAYAEMIYRKEPQYVLEVLKKIVKEWGKPQQIQSDAGTEYLGVVKKWMTDEGIKQTMEKPPDGMIHYKQGIVERFNRTLLGYLKKYITRMRSNKIIDILPDLIKQYNQTYHSTLKTSPNQVFKGNEEPINIFLTTDDVRNELQTEFSVGDVVRVRNNKTIFTKGREERYSRNKYKVISRVGNKYILSNNTEYSYNQLMKVMGEDDYKEEEKPKPQPKEKPVLELREKSTRERKQRKIMDL